jgi:hypothetical protein
MPIRRLVLAGLGAMGAAGIGSAISPSIAGVVSGLFVTVLVLTTAVPVTLAARWVRGELAWRRELRAMGPVSAEQAIVPEPVAPTLAELRESA